MEELQAAYDEEKKRATQLEQRVAELEAVLLDDVKISAWRQLNCIDDCKVTKAYETIVTFSNGYVALYKYAYLQFGGKINKPTDIPLLIKVNQKVIDICSSLASNLYFITTEEPLLFEEPTSAYLAMSQKEVCIVFQGPKIGKCHVVFKKKVDINFIDTNIQIENLLEVV